MPEPDYELVIQRSRIEVVFGSYQVLEMRDHFGRKVMIVPALKIQPSDRTHKVQ